VTSATEVSYHAGVISEQEAASTLRDATEIVAIAQAMLATSS
jgi:hypothetical protein